MFVSFSVHISETTPLTSVRCDLQLHKSHPAYEIAPRGLQMDSAANGQYATSPTSNSNNKADKSPELANVRVSADERAFLKRKCPYLNDAYITFLETFQLKPAEQLEIKFTPSQDTGSDEDEGNVEYIIKGLWLDTILYEIPLLALTSQAYFMFTDKEWDYHQQEEKAFRKGCTLLENGCVFSEFGTRRRRDYHTQELVMQGLSQAAAEGKKQGWKGAFTGTSNVHFAMKYDTNAVGTVAHEWYMTIAAITDDYENANELALQYWLGCFGEGVSTSFKGTVLLQTDTNRSLVSLSRIHSELQLSSKLSVNLSHYQSPIQLLAKSTETRVSPRYTRAFVKIPVTLHISSRWCESSMIARVSRTRRSLYSPTPWISSTVSNTRLLLRRLVSHLLLAWGLFSPVCSSQ